MPVIKSGRTVEIITSFKKKDINKWKFEDKKNNNNDIK